MPYVFLADLVVVVHFGFIVFVTLGGLLALRWPRVALAHLPALAWGALVMFLHWTCPLTPLENALRRAAGQAGYEAGFMETYLWPVIYPPGLTLTHQIVLGAALIGLNLVVYLAVWCRTRPDTDGTGP